MEMGHMLKTAGSCWERFSVVQTASTSLPRPPLPSQRGSESAALTNGFQTLAWLHLHPIEAWHFLSQLRG